MTDHARTLLAQHARTTQLLGVDFLPLGTPPATTHFAANSATRNSDSEAAQATSVIEPKPAPDFNQSSQPNFNAAPSTAQPESQPASPSAFPKMDLKAIRACHQAATDPQSKLDALRDQYTADAPHQHFVTVFNNIVFGEGDPAADLMFVGEAPGQEEDETGRPFVGRAGQLLEKMIIAMGLTRESVYIANVLKTRPPNNATPTKDEAALCAPYLFEQIKIINPKIIVTLGLPASQLLLESTQPMRSLRGSFQDLPASTTQAHELPAIAVMPTYHPAFLLRAYTEDNRRKVWSDLTQVIDRLGLKDS